jgi:hypothetical protein
MKKMTYRRYFEMFDRIDDEMRKLVSDYIIASLSDGLYRTRVNKKLAVLYWSGAEEKGS